jgi:hypothetical protein
MPETVAMVRLDRDFASLVPFPNALADAVLKKLDGLVRVGSRQFRMSVDVALSVGRRSIVRRVLFEPRAISPDDSRIYWTQSPLDFDQHMEVFQQILAK